jgi:hypothetical protein
MYLDYFNIFKYIKVIKFRSFPPKHIITVDSHSQNMFAAITGNRSHHTCNNNGIRTSHSALPFHHTTRKSMYCDACNSGSEGESLMISAYLDGNTNNSIRRVCSACCMARVTSKRHVKSCITVSDAIVRASNRLKRLDGLRRVRVALAVSQTA